MSTNEVPQLSCIEFNFKCDLCGAPQIISVYVEAQDVEGAARYLSELISPICHPCWVEATNMKLAFEFSEWEKNNGLHD